MADPRKMKQLKINADAILEAVFDFLCDEIRQHNRKNDTKITISYRHDGHKDKSFGQSHLLMSTGILQVSHNGVVVDTFRFYGYSDGRFQANPPQVFLSRGHFDYNESTGCLVLDKENEEHLKTVVQSIIDEVAAFQAKNSPTYPAPPKRPSYRPK